MNQELIEYCERRMKESGITTGYYAKIKDEISQEATDSVS